MEANAKAYNEVSGPQIDVGIKLIRELNLSAGDKVLDMGCGTGHVSKIIADIVGPDGLVVGVDPNAVRIKIAKENYKAVSNLQFYVGDSVSGFPHDNEPYYDFHISTNVLHWVRDDEKLIYLRKAFECLKFGGRLAIWCGTKIPDIEKTIPTFSFLSQEGYRGLFQDVGLFSDVIVDQSICPLRFKSLEQYKQWYKATVNLDVDPVFIKKYVTAKDDGQVVYIIPFVTITAFKKCNVIT